MLYINKKVIFILAIIVGMITLITLITHTQMKLQEIDLVDASKAYIFQLTLYSLFFGILLEWNGLKELFKKNIRLNNLILACIIVGILSFIPKHQWLSWFGLNLTPEGWRLLITPLYLDGTHIVLGILTGILLVRSFVKTEYN